MLGDRRWLAWWGLVAGAVLFVGGIGAMVVDSGSGLGRGRVVGGNLRVNRAADDVLSLGAENSPVLVANPIRPANLVVAGRIDAPRFGCGLHVSRDGGRTWADRPAPSAGSGSVTCFAPDAAFGPDGTLYLSFTSFGEVPGSGTVPDAVWVATSRDGGWTFAPPTRAWGPLAFQVRLAADPARSGRVYLAWLQASGTSSWGLTETGNPILLARSNDGAASWDPPRRVSAASRLRVVAPSMAVGAGGGVQVAYLDVGNDRLDYHGGHEGRGGPPHPGPWALVMSRSNDGGGTWRESVVDDSLVPVERFLVLFPAAPAVAFDRSSGGLYIAYHDARSGDADVAVWSSRDAGVTWSPARRVNDTTARDRTTQYLPQLGVAPDGRLIVVYYDRRADRADVANEVSLQSSSDDGRSFGPRLRLSDRAFDSRVGWGADRGLPQVGSRLGVLATDGGALAVWADTREGTVLSGRQDLARAVVALGREGGGADGAGVAIPAGLAVALAGWRVGRRRRSRSGSGPTGAAVEAAGAC